MDSSTRWGRRIFMTTCKRCWNQLPDTANFCGLCGHSTHLMSDSTNVPTERNRYTSIYMAASLDNKGAGLSDDQILTQRLLYDTNGSAVPDRDKNSSILMPLPSPSLPSKYLPSPSVEDQSHLHGMHQQAGFEHGMHQQAGFEHGMHQQAGFKHGMHQQTCIQHGMHQQTGFEHGMHQPAGLEHGMHQQATFQPGMHHHAC